MCANCPHSALPPVGSTTNSMPKWHETGIRSSPKGPQRRRPGVSSLPFFLALGFLDLLPRPGFLLGGESDFLRLDFRSLGQSYLKHPLVKAGLDLVGVYC